MKILLVVNKTLRRGEEIKFDASYFNFYIPFLQLGHEVYLYDTIDPYEKNFNKLVETFKPDLIFCIISGNKAVVKYEPLDEIYAITKQGNIKTFNWFCDDTWRFNNFSKFICHYFTACSTPEFSYINKFKDSGYKNILLGQWHCNEDLYIKNAKNKNITFCGGLNETRLKWLKLIEKDVNYLYGCSYEDLINAYSSSKISLNFTKNGNDPLLKRQMKLRIFEATCANSLLLTENVDDIDLYYKPNEEIVTFEDMEECIKLLNFYLNNDSERERISNNGRNRFLKEHTSKIRLQNLLHEINKL